MSFRDFVLLSLVCLLWGSNNIVSKYVISVMEVPPLFYGAVRFAVVTLVAGAWLRPMPRPRWRLVVVGLLMGAGNFALVFIGLKYATASAVAVVAQLNVPLTALLGTVMLGERIGPRRGLGIMLTFAGAVLVIWRPGSFAASLGLLYVVGAAICGALGAVMMKQMSGVKPLQFQAWVGVTSLAPLTVLSLLVEPGAVDAGLRAGWPLAAAILYSALVVSVIGHTTYFFLIQRYEANLIVPLTLMTPLATVVLGVSLMGDPLDLRMALGAAALLLGVLVIAVRPNLAVSMLMRLRTGAR